MKTWERPRVIVELGIGAFGPQIPRVDDAEQVRLACEAHVERQGNPERNANVVVGAAALPSRMLVPTVSAVGMSEPDRDEEVRPQVRSRR